METHLSLLIRGLYAIYIIFSLLNTCFSTRIEEIAKRRGISMAQVALAWSLSKDFVTAPIVGTTSLKNFEDLISEFTGLLLRATHNGVRLDDRGLGGCTNRR
jgi:predicted oxidoreductase